MSDAVRDALEAALDAWAAKLCAMPNIRERERYDAASAILRAALASGGWRDISTAPRDGTLVLGFGLWAGEINGADVRPTRRIIYFNAGRTDYPGFDWTVAGTDAYAAWFKPTHWQPLPPAPEQSS